MTIQIGKLMGALATAATLGSYSATVCAEPMDDIPPDLHTIMQCTSDVLQRIPGVDEIKVGVFQRGKVVQPYLQYRTAALYGNRPIIVLEAHKYHEQGQAFYVFEVDLSKVSAIPREWATNRLTMELVHRCHVGMSIMQT